MSKPVRVNATEEDVADGTIGGCIRCGELQHGVEPDGRKVICESCGAPGVYGLEELIIMNLLDLTLEEDAWDNADLED